MARINKEYEWGYKQGYDFAEFEGGTVSQVYSNKVSRTARMANQENIMQIKIY